MALEGSHKRVEVHEQLELQANPGQLSKLSMIILLPFWRAALSGVGVTSNHIIQYRKLDERAQAEIG